MNDSQPWSGTLSGRLLEGRTAVITGGASVNGIGRATAQLFAAHGARVAILDIDGRGAAAVAESLGSMHLGIACDVTSRENCATAIQHVSQTFPMIDVLINNAALSKGTRILDVTDAEYDAVMDVNLRGTFMISQEVLPGMRARQSGTIVCLSSVAGQRGGGLYGSAHYAASKAAVIGLAKGMARELAPEGIRVNVVSPSLIKTDSSPSDSPERRAAFEKDVPMRRSGTVWEVAGTVLFAASDLSGYVTGATIDVNGGFHIH